MNVLDAAGISTPVEKPLAPGQALMAASRPVVIASDQSAVPVSGTITANAGTGTMAVSLASLPALVAGTAIIGKVGIDQTTPGTTNLVAAGQSGTWNITNISGTVSLPTGAATSANQTALTALFPTSLGTKTAANSLAVTLASDGALTTAVGAQADAAVANGASGSAMSYWRTIKDAVTDTTTPSPVKIDQTTDGTTNRVNAVPGSTAHALIPAPSTYRVLSAAATTNGANIKASAGTVKGIQGFNAKASAVYLKLYNKATSPTVGTDTPVKTIYLPASAAFAFDFGTGVAFATGISIAMTGAGADADTTALASGDILALNVDYH
jgi:hypothetical protein